MKDDRLLVLVDGSVQILHIDSSDLTQPFRIVAERRSPEGMDRLSRRPVQSDRDPLSRDEIPVIDEFADSLVEFLRFFRSVDLDDRVHELRDRIRDVFLLFRVQRRSVFPGDQVEDHRACDEFVPRLEKAS